MICLDCGTKRIDGVCRICLRIETLEAKIRYLEGLIENMQYMMGGNNFYYM